MKKLLDDVSTPGGLLYLVCVIATLLAVMWLTS